MSSGYKAEKGAVTAGDWLHGVSCHGCGAPLPMFHDASGGRSQFQGADPIEIQCPECGDTSSYAPGEFTSMRAVSR